MTGIISRARALLLVLCTALAFALLLAGAFHRGQKVLAQHAASNGRYDFLVLDDGKLLLASQRATIPAGNPTMKVDVSRFATFEIRNVTITVPGGAGTITAATMQLEPSSLGHHGFIWMNGETVISPSMTITLHYFGAPTWALALPLLIPPAIALRRRRRLARRVRLGLCPHCGYDLRASTDRCPECGRANNATSLVATGAT